MLAEAQSRNVALSEQEHEWKRAIVDNLGAINSVASLKALAQVKLYHTHRQPSRATLTNAETASTQQ